MIPWRKRIKFKLLFFGVTMSILPITLIAWYTFNTIGNWNEVSIREKEQAIVERVASEVEQKITAITHQIDFIIDTNEKQLDSFSVRAKWEQNFYAFLKLNSAVTNIYLFDQTGKIVVGSSRFELSTPPYIPTDLMAKIRAIDQSSPFFIGDVEKRKESDPYLVIARSFFDREGKVVGGIISEISLKSMFRQISALYMGNAGYLYLIDADQHLIAYSKQAQVSSQNKVILSNELRSFILQQQKVSQPNYYTSHTGEKVLATFASIPSMSWGVIAEQPVSLAYAPIRTLGKQIFYMMLLVMLIVVLASIFFGVWFTKPIALMEKAVHKVSKGDLRAKIDYPSMDEFGELAKAFNLMTAELKSKTDRLKQETERLDTIINGSGAGYAIINGEYQVMWMNERLKEWLGNHESGHFCYRLIGKYNKPCNNCPLITKDQKTFGQEITNKLQLNGNQLIYRHRIYPLEHVIDGSPSYLLLVEDITEQKKLEEMVMQADKLSALGILTSGFAHEINNPLASISAYTEDLKERLKEEGTKELLESQEVERYLEIIQNNVFRCKRITDSLLHFSHKSTNRLEDVDLIRIIEDTFVLMQHQFKKKNIELVNEVENLPIVHGDSFQIQQILINIIQNALDSMETGKKLRIVGFRGSDIVEIKIVDQGIGMTEEQLHKAFDPFYTTKPAGKGTGLGLYISYKMMKEMNGEISIESEEGVGTTVVLTFPIGDGQGDKGNE